MKKFQISALFSLALLITVLFGFFYPVFSEDLEILETYYSLDGGEFTEYHPGERIKVPLRVGYNYRWRQYFRTDAKVAEIEIVETLPTPNSVTEKNIDQIESSNIVEKAWRSTNGTVFMVKMPMEPKWEGYGHVSGGFDLEETDTLGPRRVMLKFKNGQTREIWFEIFPEEKE